MEPVAIGGVRQAFLECLREFGVFVRGMLGAKLLSRRDWAMLDRCRAGCQMVTPPAVWLAAGATVLIQLSALAQSRRDLQVVLPEDRAAARSLAIARDRLAAQDYEQAVNILGALLEMPGDAFCRVEDAPDRYIGLKTEAFRLLASMPPEAWESFRKRYEIPARKQLESASAAGDAGQIAEVMRRYLLTSAGQQAALMVSADHLDHGRPWAAAACLERLGQLPAEATRPLEPGFSVQLALAQLRAGLRDKAQARLMLIEAAHPRFTLPLDGREQLLFSGDPLAVLSRALPPKAVRERADPQWLLPGGDAARGGTAPASPPESLAMLWRAEAYEDFSSEDEFLGQDGDKDIARLLDEMTRSAGEIPAAQPLLVGELLLFRTAVKLVAVEAATGKRRWEASLDNEIQRLLRMYHGQADASGKYEEFNHTTPTNRYHARIAFAQALARRAWFDFAYGSLSSDGERVFCLEGLPLLPGGVLKTRRLLVSAATAEHNCLTAYSLQGEGRRLWEVGGPPGDEALPLAGTVFLGPPLPLAGRLYVLAERQGEVVVIELEAATGKAVWTQPLCGAESSGYYSVIRQMSGLMPAYADGVLVCPTGAGAVVAVDLTTKSLMWAYTYTQRLPGEELGGVPDPTVLEMGWRDGGVMVTNGVVLVSAPGTHELHCLGLLDGKPKWQRPRPRGESLIVGALHAGQIAVAGPKSLELVPLDAGRPVTASFSYPVGASLAGRGFSHGDCYYVPLSNGQLGVLDMAQRAWSVRQLAGLRGSPLGAISGDQPLRANMISAKQGLYLLDVLGLTALAQPP